MEWKLFDVSMPANASISSHGHSDRKEAYFHGNFKHCFHCRQSVHSTSFQERFSHVNFPRKSSVNDISKFTFKESGDIEDLLH